MWRIGLVALRHIGSSQIVPCLLHWQMESLPLSHQGSPQIKINFKNVYERIGEQSRIYGTFAAVEVQEERFALHIPKQAT